MSDLQQAAQQAADALERLDAWLQQRHLGGLMPSERKTLVALRAALAEPECPHGADAACVECYEQTALDLCGVCGWRTLIPGDACLNCERAKPEQPVEQALEAINKMQSILMMKDGKHPRAVLRAFIQQSAPIPQREHITDGSPCWCNPDVIEEDGGNVIVHNYDDNWQQYAKPGETAQQCIERHRSEQDALMKLYATPRKPLTDRECDEIYDALDDWAREIDPYEFGLPRISGGGAEGGRVVIRRALGITGESK